MGRRKTAAGTAVERSVRLDSRRRGYLVDGILRKGFGDDPELSDRQRLLIARWAERFSPHALTKAQRELLERAPAPSVSPTQREFAENQLELRSPYLATLFDSLHAEEQRAIQDPAAAGVAAEGYPLTVGQLATLSGASERQIRTWADEGLLPSHRQGKNRRFYSAAAIRAFALVRAPGYSKALAAAAARGEIGQHFQLLAATLAQAATKMPVDVGERLIALVEDLASSSRLMADVGDASELKALWQKTQPHPLPPPRSGPTVVPADVVVVPTAPKHSIVIEYKAADHPGSSPLQVSEADEILYAKYGGSEIYLKDIVVLTAPRGKREWINFISGHKRALSVHETKAEAEARGREIARARHGKHVIYQRNGSISRSHSYS